MTDATRRVTQWIIGVRGEVPLVEELATAEDVQSFVCGHVRWSDGTLVQNQATFFGMTRCASRSQS
jgi:hypothetical protein